MRFFFFFLEKKLLLEPTTSSTSGPLKIHAPYEYKLITLGAPTTCRETGVLLTSRKFPLILLDARQMY